MRHLVFGLVMALLLSTSAAGGGAGGDAYITNSGSSMLPVIDTATGALRVSIPLGTTTWGVAMDPKGARVYVTSPSTGAVYAIATSDKQVKGSVVVGSSMPGVIGSSALGVAVSPDGRRLYVTHTVTVANGRFRRPIPGFVSAVDVSSTGALSLAGSPLMLGGGTTGVAVSPSGDLAYVANSTGKVSVIDLTGQAGMSLVGTAFVSADPLHSAALVGVAVSPDGRRLYLADRANDKLVVLDPGGIVDSTSVMCTTVAAPLVGCVAVGNSPYGVAVSPNGKRVFVANSGSHNVSVIDTSAIGTDQRVVIQTTDVGDGPGVGPHGIAVSADSRKVYVVNTRTNLIWVLNGTTGEALLPPIADPSLISPIGFGPFTLGASAIQVRIDVVPSVVNRKAQGTVPVKIFSSDCKTNCDYPEFYVHDLTYDDLLTIRLNGLSVKINQNGEPMVNYGDFDGDGLDDMMVHISMDGVLDSSDSATLVGQTHDGTSFQGSDAVKFLH